jgi:GDPmannose 4,6-dehydratase
MIAAGRQDRLELGDLGARRDWGFAGDYANAMWQMLQAPAASDYVVATGQTHSVRDLCEIAFRRVGLDYASYVVESAGHKRPPETIQLVGDATRARQLLGWTPAVSFVELIEMMVDADVLAIESSKVTERQTC